MYKDQLRGFHPGYNGVHNGYNSKHGARHPANGFSPPNWALYSQGVPYTLF